MDSVQEEYVIVSDSVSTAARRLHAELEWLHRTPDLLMAEAFHSPSCLTRATVPIVAALEQCLNLNDGFIEFSRPHRLGFHFENLVACQLELLPEVDRIVRNLPIRGEYETLGEMDFLFRHNQRWFHLEVALKLFLYTGANGGDLGDFVGLLTHDTLEAKWHRLRTHQLPLCERPESQKRLAELGIHELPAPKLLFKGWLFYHCYQRPRRYPLPIADNHAQGWWIRRGEIDWLATQGERFRVLCKGDWLLEPTLIDDLPETGKIPFPQASSELMTLAELRLWIDSFLSGVLVSVVESKSSGMLYEVSRGFVVSDDWNRES